MEASRALISQIFSTSRLLEIPFYQRSYVWGEEQWARFIDDMEFVTKTSRSYFMGSVILKQAPIQSTNVYSDKRIVIDGQQRLTTIMIFLKVLLLKENNNKLFDKNYRLDDDTIQLLHGRNDKEAFQMVVNQTVDEELPDDAHTSSIIKAFNYFRNNIDMSKIDRNIIQQYVQFVCIDLGQEEDEQQVFNTINSLGVKLTTAELLKNYFFDRNNVSDYDNKWVAVFEKDDDARDYWNHEIEAGSNKRAMIDVFLDAYFQMFLQNKNYKVSVEDKIFYSRIDRIAQSYQDFVNKYAAGDKNVFLSDMAEYAGIFRRTFDPEQRNRKIPKGFGIERMNVIIFGLKNSTVIPYVLYVAKNVDDDEARKIYRVLETYLMRRIVTHASTRSYKNMFLSLISNEIKDAKSLYSALNKNPDVTTYMPDDAELKSGFHNSTLINQQTKGILYFIESAIRPDNSATELYGFDQYSLEHMMPKKWRNNWDACADEEAAMRRDFQLLTLGNLAIITQSLNASIRDSSWTEKRTGKNGKAGLDACAGGLTTICDALKKDSWTEDDIKDRAEWLYERAKELWTLDCVKDAN